MALPPALRTSTPISVACGSTVTTIARRAWTGRLAQRASPGASERSVANRPRNVHIRSILPKEGFRMSGGKGFRISDVGFRVCWLLLMGLIAFAGGGIDGGCGFVVDRKSVV